MSTLIRNLLICFLLVLMTMFMATIWYKEARQSPLDYSKVIELLDNDQIVSLEFDGNSATVTDQNKKIFITTVPDISIFLEKVHKKNIRVSVKQDRFTLIYTSVLGLVVVLLVMITLWSGRKVT